jgi:hypothetical protein
VLAIELHQAFLGHDEVTDCDVVVVNPDAESIVAVLNERRSGRAPTP